MPELFEIEDGVLKKYCGGEAHVAIPEGVTEIGDHAFYLCKDVFSVDIPSSVRKIDEAAFYGCEGLASLVIPDGVTEIGEWAFSKCTSLASVSIPEGVTEIGDCTFDSCECLSSIDIPDSIAKIGKSAFNNCKKLTSFRIPDGVTEIGIEAFRSSGLSSITIPGSVTMIWSGAFMICKDLNSVEILDGVREIGGGAFKGCKNLALATIPRSVTEIAENIIWGGAFERCPVVTIVCSEGSYAQSYCEESHLAFVFDYQYEAFHGVLPPGIEKLASPFLADEEGPYVFVSYSHKDRDEVLPILKELYEDGWRIWYDEGLTIGDRYDETLEAHIRNCSAFLLFVTARSRESVYIKENEIPWAMRYGRPIVECALDEGARYELEEGSVAVAVPPLGIGHALEGIEGLVRGERRVAKGISVVVDPAARQQSVGGFAYCLYSERSAAAAKAIMLEARRAGCVLYDAVEEGPDLARLRRSASLVAFLDKAFLQDENLVSILTGKYLEGSDVAVCALEVVEDVDLPERLIDLNKEQWLDFAHGISADMCTKLVRHLHERGCRDASALPGFEYETTSKGIVIKRYTGFDPNPRIDASYGGVPVVRIDAGAFEGCVHLEEIVIPDGVTVIGQEAFRGCTNLVSITIPESVEWIRKLAFLDCTSLSSVTIPDGMIEIDWGVFSNCTSLASIALPDSVIWIEEWAFKGCKSLASIEIPKGLRRIGAHAFKGCSNLVSIDIPESVTEIRESAFRDCSSLTSVVIPEGVTVIEESAFAGCSSLASVAIPESVTTIGRLAFRSCWSLTSIAIPESVNVIEDEAFCYCTSLASATIPDGVKILDTSLFGNCTSLSSVAIPDSVTLIWGSVFAHCKSLTSITIPDGVTIIGGSAFYGCESLSSVTVPDSVTWIGSNAFEGCTSLTSVVLSENVTEIGEDAFSGCEMLTVTCPEDSYAWDYCEDRGVPVKPSPPVDEPVELSYDR